MTHALWRASFWEFQMSKSVTISKPLWVTIWAVAMLQTLVGSIGRPETWKVDVQFPGIMLALYLQWFLGPIALLFGKSGGVFILRGDDSGKRVNLCCLDFTDAAGLQNIYENLKQTDRQILRGAWTDFVLSFPPK